ncbi:MAG: hypothetical protein RL062_290, partial [Bacteroidota bacterium]
KVYLTYGDGTYYNESISTGAFGEFQFDNLQIGQYKVYVLSKNTTTGEMTEVIEQKVKSPKMKASMN